MKNKDTFIISKNKKVITSKETENKQIKNLIMYELQKYKVHITCRRNHWGWGYNNVFRKYAKTCIRENEGKNKIYCNCHSGWDKNLHVKV